MRKLIYYAMVMLAVAGLCSSTVTRVPPTEKDLEGTWIGLPDQGNYYCRLILTNNGGLFARSVDMQNAMIYVINSYKADGNHISFRISAGSTNAFRIQISGKAAFNEIRMT